MFKQHILTTGRLTARLLSGGAITVAAMLAASPAFATCPITNTLSNGNPADANQVMTNFTDLANCVGNVPTFNGPVSIITQNATASTALQLLTPSTGQQALVLLNGAGTNYWQYGKDTDNSFIVFDDVAGRYDIRAFSNSNMSLMPGGGYVGIGTDSPGAPLDVESPSITSLDIANFLAPSLTAGSTGEIRVGSSASTGNSAELRFQYQGNNSSANRLDLAFYGVGTPALSVTNSGQVGIGTPSPTAMLSVVGNVDVNGGTVVVGSAAPQSFAGVSTPIQALGIGSTSVGIGEWAGGRGAGPTLSFYKSNGGSIGSHAAVTNSNSLGALAFLGDDGVTAGGVSGASISVQARGTWSSSSRPASMGFYVTPGPASGEAMDIASSGAVSIPAGILVGGGLAAPVYLLDANVSDNTSNKIRVANTTSNGASAPGGWGTFEALGARGDGNGSFEGRFAASFRRTDGTAIAPGTRIGTMAFGGQWGTDTTYNQTNLLYPASIQGIAEGNFTASTAMPTGLAFLTGSTGQDIQTGNTTYGTERMRITSGGSVGIGTASPGSTLDVVGDINTAVGSGYKTGEYSLLYGSTTNDSLAVGLSAGGSWIRSISTNLSNVAVGNRAMFSTISSSAAIFNTAVGTQALYALTTGYYNTAIGGDALSVNTSGTNNTAVGLNALFKSTAGVENVAIGASTLTVNQGNDDVAVGYAAANGTTTSYTSQGVTVVGALAGYALNTGSDYNTLFGYKSGQGLSTGSRNVLIGPSTIGASNAQVTTGSDNIAIGNDVAVPSATASNQLVIGNLIYGTGLSGTGGTVSGGNIGVGVATPAARLSVKGLGTTTGLTFQTTNSAGTALVTMLDSGKVGIGTASPAQALDVAGSIKQSGCTTATTLSADTSGNIICTPSDARLKNIFGNYTGGLPEIARLVPKTFSYKPTAATATKDFVHAGFIAQDVKQVIPQAVAAQRNGFYTIDTTAILAASVNAIKELNKQNHELRAANDLLTAKLTILQRADNRQAEVFEKRLGELEKRMNTRTAMK